ncbi:hypothetical protein Daesc_007906 [Daldinia eschscholtzii]|uniref:Uncharacterized protein n=1 Tax=Daldinia eschscholtzii TaxID=292717 RepID=A0AAX6MGS9_9PEZI
MVAFLRDHSSDDSHKPHGGGGIGKGMGTELFERIREGKDKPPGPYGKQPTIIGTSHNVYLTVNSSTSTSSSTSISTSTSTSTSPSTSPSTSSSGSPIPVTPPSSPTATQTSTSEPTTINLPAPTSRTISTSTSPPKSATQGATAAGSEIPTRTKPTPYGTPSNSASLSTQSTSTESVSRNQQFPTWAIPVIVIVGLVILVFLASLAAFISRERRRKKEAGGGKDQSYVRALRRAGAVASGLFIPIWIVKRYRRGRKNEDQEQREMYDSRAPEYGKLEEQTRHSEEIAGRTPPPQTSELAVSPVSLERGNSVVSSLSSSTRSQGRYERLDIPPSPMSEDAPYPWRSQDILEMGSGSFVEKREASMERAERPRSETPLARRSDSMSEKRGPGG